MKTLRKILILVLMVGAGLSVVNAQATKKDKQAAKEKAVQKSIDTNYYTFIANYVLPQGGGGHSLDPDYDLRITKDSVIATLPYFGESYFDAPYGGEDAGIKFTSTKFNYSIKEKKQGGWIVVIKPSDAKHINSLILDISKNGYATLSINSTNRSYIRFNGYLKE
ncbi:MAG: DUF4251 domain-containing protein [Mucilaginibacter sp.]